MGTMVYRPTRIRTTNPTPIIIQDIIATVLISDGAVIEGITVITIIIGVTIDPVIITKTTPITITEAIKREVATIIIMETINGKGTMNVNGDVELIPIADGLWEGELKL
jgi:hypothetical protein